MSLGEDRVRVKFNPSADGAVEVIKQKTAELINYCNQLDVFDEDAPAEQQRLVALACTAYETAAMWAVKAATMGK